MLNSYLRQTADLVEGRIDRLLGAPGDHAAPRLAEAMRYAALGGGKRLRAALVRATAETVAVGQGKPHWQNTAAAIEALHAYSLIHDDLPAMDDATLRRGKPACHRAFDEATAILAGDALQAASFAWIADDADLPADVRVALLSGLAAGAGLPGMCGGQMLDLEGEATPPDLEGLERMERLKTGALIAYSVDAGAIVAGAGPEERRHLAGWAGCLGLAFQITDDLLDVEGDKASIGKDHGLDAARGKTTFVSLIGSDAARERLVELAREAGDHLDRLGRDAPLLRAIFDYVLTRDR